MDGKTQIIETPTAGADKPTDTVRERTIDERVHRLEQVMVAMTKNEMVVTQNMRNLGHHLDEASTKMAAILTILVDKGILSETNVADIMDDPTVLGHYREILEQPNVNPATLSSKFIVFGKEFHYRIESMAVLLMQKGLVTLDELNKQIETLTAKEEKPTNGQVGKPSSEFLFVYSGGK